jgi:two-component system LytT family response regulator
MSESAHLRVIIVDDEEPARMAVRHDLESLGGVTIVAECANGFEAVRAVNEQPAEQPVDLLLLDVQMPKLDGFDVLELIGRDVPVIFITAYDEFALRAFEVHAVDYLLKPFARERLHEALERARARRSQPTTPGPDPITVREAARPNSTILDRLVIRDGPNVHVVPVEKIDFIEAQDDYVAVHAAGKSHLKEQTLGDLERQLESTRFVRVHRSFILNIERLARVELYAKDSRIAILHDGRKVPISRTGYQRLQELL